jgi:hypothetical protein
VNKSNFFLSIGIISMIVGFVIAWPLVYAAMQYTMVPGKVVAIMVLPVNEQQSRVAFAYDYRVGGRQGDIALGYALADDRLEIIDDPIVSHEVARRTHAQLDGQSVRVYVDMNRPYTTAFMLNPMSELRGIRPEQGALLVMFGIACSILAQLNRIRR